MTTIVFSDRDGTINKDENYFLGSKPNWRDQVSFLEGVIEGIRMINTIPDSYFFIVTNQAGIALQGPEFDLLTEKRLEEVNDYILEELKKRSAKVDGLYSCPYIDLDYVKRSVERGRSTNPDYVKDNHPDLKPNIGMIEKALQSLNLDRNDCDIYMIGDRITDVKMGLNAGGTGILVESSKTRERGDVEKVQSLQGKTYIARNFLDAAEFILKNTNS
ncbi:hypothetical protein CMI42_02965 [Candidatus Pacearchaeota archaeon]|nr:hypothetical protein [Candidatus Pacearchaeota archaeon]|tara:strand:+ start:868 stop:1518 length:651 start_codon:yes stop_codon:yes gene_type:complete